MCDAASGQAKRAILISSERGRERERERMEEEDETTPCVTYRGTNPTDLCNLVPCPIEGVGEFTVKAGETNPPCYPRATLAPTRHARPVKLHGVVINDFNPRACQSITKQRHPVV